MPEINIPPAAPQGPQLPPIDPKALVDTAIAVIRNPTDFYKGIRGETGFQKCLIFSVAMGVIYGALSFLGLLLWGIVHGAFGLAFVTALTALISGAIGGVIGPFVGGLIVWGVSLAFGSKATWEPSVRIAAYAMAVMPAFALGSLLPGILAVLGALISFAAFIYEVYICVMGAKVINFEAPPAATTPPA